MSTEGGKIISIHGTHFSGSGSDFRVWLRQGSNAKASTAQTHDDSFNSNVKGGLVAHKIAPIGTVFGASSVHGDFDVLLKDKAGIAIPHNANIADKAKLTYSLNRTP